MSQISSIMFHDLYDSGGESSQGAINWEEFKKIDSSKESYLETPGKIDGKNLVN